MRPLLLEDYVVPICSARMITGKAMLSCLLGTAFFVDERGVFLTARHVAEATRKDSTVVYGLVVKSDETSGNSEFAQIVEWEYAPSPHDVAIGRVNFRSNPWFSVYRDVYMNPWKDVATLGYPETALNVTSDEFNVHIRALKGYIQRFVEAGEIDLIRPHPACYELSFPITLGMSGSPLFSAEGTTQELIGVCIGSFKAEIVEYLSEEISEDGKEFKEKHLKVEQIGIAQSILPLRKWTPTVLGGKCLGECFHS